MQKLFLKKSQLPLRKARSRQQLNNQPQNEITLGGILAKRPVTRKTPAGIPITQFTLEHSSEQREAGMARQVQFRIVVIATGDELQKRLSNIGSGDYVTVSGFLNKSVYRGSEVKIVVHAASIN